MQKDLTVQDNMDKTEKESVLTRAVAASSAAYSDNLLKLQQLKDKHTQEQNAIVQQKAVLETLTNSYGANSSVVKIVKKGLDALTESEGCTEQL